MCGLTLEDWLSGLEEAQSVDERQREVAGSSAPTTTVVGQEWNYLEAFNTPNICDDKNKVPTLILTKIIHCVPACFVDFHCFTISRRKLAR